MRELPQNFPREVRKRPHSFTDVLQDHIDKDNADAYYEHVKNILKEQSVEIKNLKVLEIGSGNGIFLDFLRKKGVNAVGLDVRSGGYGSPQVAARIEQIPLKSDEFDLVLSLGNVFDQMVYDQDHDLMIREIYRVLKPKGLYLGYGLAKIKASPIEGFTELIKPGEDNIFRHLYQKS